MDKVNKMCCPHCGYRIGISWLTFPARHKKDGPFTFARECKICKTPLALEGKSAQVALRIKQTAIFPNIIFWTFTGVAGIEKAVERAVIKTPVDHVMVFFSSALPYAFFCALSFAAVMYVANRVCIKTIKDAGYLSLAHGAKHVFKHRWYSN